MAYADDVVRRAGAGIGHNAARLTALLADGAERAGLVADADHVVRRVGAGIGHNSARPAVLRPKGSGPIRLREWLL